MRVRVCLCVVGWCCGGAEAEVREAAVPWKVVGLILIPSVGPNPAPLHRYIHTAPVDNPRVGLPVHGRTARASDPALRAGQRGT